MATCGVYKITNIITNECYIGCSNNVERRLISHKKGLSSNSKLQDSIKKYLIKNFKFEILEECDKEELRIREYFYIEKYQESLFNKKLGRKKIEDRSKVMCAVACNCYLGLDKIIKLGGIKVVRKIFQDAGNKAIIDELNKIKLC